VIIRDAHQDEFPEIGDIRVGAYLAGGFLTTDSGYAARLRELGTDGLGPVLVALDRERGRLLGTVMLTPWPNGGPLLAGPGEAEIRALAVRPEAQGAGVGRALLAAVIDRAAGDGVRHLVLSTQPDMKVAHLLYERARFIRLPRRDWSPEPGVDLLAYGLRIPSAGRTPEAAGSGHAS
jgi:ribosomal protein S18 acetylase RimI-like enzyme